MHPCWDLITLNYSSSELKTVYLSRNSTLALYILYILLVYFRDNSVVYSSEVTWSPCHSSQIANIFTFFLDCFYLIFFLASFPPVSNELEKESFHCHSVLNNPKPVMFSGASGILTIINWFVQQLSIECSAKQNTPVQKINMVLGLIELVINSGPI